jgi:hypothetical protein
MDGEVVVPVPSNSPFDRFHIAPTTRAFVLRYMGFSTTTKIGFYFFVKVQV